MTRRIGRRLRRALLGPDRYPVVLDATGLEPARASGAALLVYLPRAFAFPAGHQALLAHANLTRCRRMAAVLDEHGFVVDVVHKRDDRFRPPRTYDLVISERADWRGRERPFDHTATTLFLATAQNHRHHNRSVQRRHDRLAERRGCTVRHRRTFPESMPALAAADALATVGSARVVGGWREWFPGPVLGFETHAVVRLDAPGKNFAAARRHFLFLASGCQLEKGLDLLLELFPRHPELHLYVCSNYSHEPDFCRCYRRELFETPNVHPLGWAPLDGPLFRELVRRCGYVVHPSCSEGQSGSAVTGMACGLVPLVTRETEVDVDGFGAVFADDSLAEIGRVIVEAAGRDPDLLERQSLLARRAADRRHTPEAFTRRWRQILEDVLR